MEYSVWVQRSDHLWRSFRVVVSMGSVWSHMISKFRHTLSNLEFEIRFHDAARSPIKMLNASERKICDAIGSASKGGREDDMMQG